MTLNNNISSKVSVNLDPKKRKKQLKLATELFEAACDNWYSQDYDDALQQFQVCLAIREALLGKYHYQTGRAYYSMGCALHGSDNFDQALVALRRSMRIATRLEDPARQKGANDYIEWVLQKSQSTPTEVKSYKAELKTSIEWERKGDIASKEGNYTTAKESYEKALASEIEAVDGRSNHLDVADLFVKLASVSSESTTWDKALDIYMTTFGPDHPYALQAMKKESVDFTSKIPSTAHQQNKKEMKPPSPPAAATTTTTTTETTTKKEGNKSLLGPETDADDQTKDQEIEGTTSTYESSERSMNEETTTETTATTTTTTTTNEGDESPMDVPSTDTDDDPTNDQEKIDGTNSTSELSDRELNEEEEGTVQSPFNDEGATIPDNTEIEQALPETTTTKNELSMIKASSCDNSTVASDQTPAEQLDDDDDGENNEDDPTIGKDDNEIGNLIPGGAIDEGDAEESTAATSLDEASSPPAPASKKGKKKSIDDDGGENTTCSGKKKKKKKAKNMFDGDDGETKKTKKKKKKKAKDGDATTDDDDDDEHQNENGDGVTPTKKKKKKKKEKAAVENDGDPTNTSNGENSSNTKKKKKSKSKDGDGGAADGEKKKTKKKGKTKQAALEE